MGLYQYYSDRQYLGAHLSPVHLDAKVFHVASHVLVCILVWLANCGSHRKRMG
jgi:hypothetical protein